MKLKSWAHLFLFDTANRHQGLQVASAIIIAYVASLAVGLPERFWAVMSVLIVMRPNSASTFDAALDRAGSTLLGAVCGLLGLGLEQLGASALLITLGIVALLAYGSAAAPKLRGAPIAALIVVSSASLMGHTALQVALLRVIQIVIGVGVAAIISAVSSKYRAADRVTAGCAKLLRAVATRLEQAGGHTAPGEAPAEFFSSHSRRALDRLTRLASSADRVSRVLRRRSPTSGGAYYRRIAGLTSRVFQDVAVVNRIMLVDAAQKDEELSHEAGRVVSAALVSTANAMEGSGEVDLGRLRELAREHVAKSGGEDSTLARPLLIAPLHLLAEDLQRLSQVLRSGPKRVPHRDPISAPQN